MDIKEYLEFKIKDEQELAKRDDYYRARVSLMKHLLQVINDNK